MKKLKLKTQYLEKMRKQYQQRPSSESRMVLPALNRGNHAPKMRKKKRDQANILHLPIMKPLMKRIMKMCLVQKKMMRMRRNNVNQITSKGKGTIKTLKQGNNPLRILPITSLHLKVLPKDSQITNSTKTNKQLVIEVI